jgi:hypothetical protein
MVNFGLRNNGIFTLNTDGYSLPPGKIVFVDSATAKRITDEFKYPNAEIYVVYSDEAEIINKDPEKFIVEEGLQVKTIAERTEAALPEKKQRSKKPYSEYRKNKKRK